MALQYSTPSSAPKLQTQSHPHTQTNDHLELSCDSWHGRLGHVAWDALQDPVTLSVVTVSLSAAPSYIHSQSTRKYREGLGKRLKARVSDISLKAGG